MESSPHLRLNRSATADLFDAIDWPASSLGPVASWPPPLRQAVQNCLNSRFPMAIGWGEPLVHIYNDGYLPIVGHKHPRAFGAWVKDVYAEIWDWYLGIKLDHVLQTGEVVWETDFRMPLVRDSAPREGYFTFCYSPIFDDGGEVSGIMSVATETTTTVLERRRREVVEQLIREFADIRSLDAVPEALQRALALNVMDCREYALLRTDAKAEPEVMFSSSEKFPSRLESFVGEVQNGVVRLDEDTFSINANPELVESDHGYRLIVKKDPLVWDDTAFLEFLDRIRKSLGIGIRRLRADERALGERDKLYRMLYEYSQDGMFLTRPNGDILAANPAACEMLGYTEEEILGLGRDGLFFENDEALREALVQRHRAGSFTGELVFRRKDGTPLPTDLSTVEFHDERGEVRSVVMIRDAQGRHLAEARNQRSARLEAVGQLTGGVAHDFNNLLQVIIGGADELLRLVPQEDAARDFADMVFSASLKAADLTRQLLAFGRQQSLRPNVVAMPDLVREVDQILDRAIGERIQVHIELAEDTNVFLDPSQLQSALINLAINAKDAMPGGGSITLGSYTTQVDEALAGEIECEPGRYVLIYMSDTGTGIPAPEISKVIEPFYSTKTRGEGTGLGLSMVFGFVRQSGGGMRILSEEGRGTRVELYFPASAQVDEAQHLPEQGEEPAAEAYGQRILIVEDNDLLATMLSRMLEELGYRVERCGSGEQAQHRLNDPAAGVDLMITDVILGAGVDGWQVIETAEKVRPGLPIIVMSGFAEIKHNRREDLPLLHKPFRIAQVRALIERFLA